MAVDNQARIKELEECLSRIINRCRSMAKADTKGLLLSTLLDAEDTLGPLTPPSPTKPSVGQQERLEGGVCLCAGWANGRTGDRAVAISVTTPNPLCPIHGDNRDTSMGTVG